MNVFAVLHFPDLYIMAIQIFSDTQGGGGGGGGVGLDKVSHELPASLNYDLNAFGSKKSWLRERLGFKRHFFLINFIV